MCVQHLLWLLAQNNSTINVIDTSKSVHRNYTPTDNISRTLVATKLLITEMYGSWSIIACQRCSNFIFILNLTPSMDEARRLRDEARNI